MKNKRIAKLLREATDLATKMPKNQGSIIDQHILDDDVILANAIRKVELSQVKEQTDSESSKPTPNANTDDKGLFGNRQIEFSQDVYYMPKQLSGDKSQPVGLLTQSDLSNYVAFRKGDRLTFRYLKGDAGNCHYEAKRNGEESFKCEFEWSDGLIQELIDEGAAKLI